MVNMGALTIIFNIYGNPAVSIPADTVRNLRWCTGARPAPRGPVALRRRPRRQRERPLADGGPGGQRRCGRSGLIAWVRTPSRCGPAERLRYPISRST